MHLDNRLQKYNKILIRQAVLENLFFIYLSCNILYSYFCIKTIQMNPNTEYELFTQSVYQQLVDMDVAKATEVEHNKQLEGRSGQKHQIDVYWEYEIAKTKHRVAIECKNYNKPISKQIVCAFKGVLDDLNGVSGIMVTRIGYQKGAKEYAKEYGISLKELRSPKRGETIIGEIVHHIHIESRQILYKVDEEWATKHQIDIAEYKQRMDMIRLDHNHKWSNATHIPLPNCDGIIRNSKGKEISSTAVLEKTIPDHPTDDFPIVFRYEDAYVSSPWGLLKILEVMFDYEIDDQETIITLDAEGFVKAILKDALSDKTDYLVIR